MLGLDYEAFNMVFISMAGTAKQIRKPKPWKFPRPVTWSQLVQMRYEFWDTAPHHGGKKGKKTERSSGYEF